MEIELKNGRWQTTDGRQFKELNSVDKLLFDVLIGVEKILIKYKLVSEKEQTPWERLFSKIGIEID
jgi:hypothetical protein